MPESRHISMLKLQHLFHIFVVSVFLLNSCAFSERVFQDSTQQSDPKEKGSLIYYVGVNHLKLYSESNSSSKIITRLPKHQKVLRSRLDKGFAYVTVAGNGLKGWVDNAQLIWKLPARTTTTKVDKVPFETSKSEPKITEKPASTETAAPAEPQEPDAVNGSQPATIPSSIFNPF